MYFSNKLYISESFQHFDYGETFPSPPRYDLRKVTCPVFFVTSEKDVYSVKEVA